jgi:hypothetical protein
LTSQIAGLTTRIELLSSGDLASDIAAKVEKQVKASLPNIIQQEIKKK